MGGGGGSWISAPSGVQACLVLVEKRETRYRVMWYYRLFEETQRGLTRYPNSLEHIHGSLLALGELLRHTGAAALWATWGRGQPAVPTTVLLLVQDA